jgi:hypothetical protein
LRFKTAGNERKIISIKNKIWNSKQIHIDKGIAEEPHKPPKAEAVTNSP